MSNRGLSIDDFDLNGEYGCQGAKLEKVGHNHFILIPGTNPKDVTAANKPQFIINQNARGNNLRMDISVPLENGGKFPITEYSYSWSYDNKHWNPISLNTDNPAQNTFEFPTFTEDRVYFGHQVPLSYEKMVELIKDWEKNENVNIVTLGKSLEGRDIYRIEITQSDSPYDRRDRWVHYFINVHPGEHNSQWRMIGMIDWLLSEEGADMRRRSICHFVLMMSVDAPSKGWYRTNKQGCDMNRGYLYTGADRDRQPHEAYLCQSDIEDIMKSDAPITTLWNMHTWQGPVEPIIFPGPEFEGSLGDWTLLRDIMRGNDPEGYYVKQLQIGEERTPNRPMGLEVGWNGGPKRQFGITTILCEGGSTLKTKEKNKESGIVIIKSLAEFYRETKSFQHNM